MGDYLRAELKNRCRLQILRLFAFWKDIQKLLVRHVKTTHHLIERKWNEKIDRFVCTDIIASGMCRDDGKTSTKY